MIRPLLTSLALATALVAPSAAAGQNVVLDEGEFVIHLNGEEAGRESFAIRRLGSADEARVIARADVTLPGRQMVPALEASPALVLLRYQLKVSGDETADVRLARQGRRFVASVHSESGARERELRAHDGSVVLQDLIAHQYYFLGPVASEVGLDLPLLDPRGDRQGATVTVVSSEQASATVGGSDVPCRRLTLSVDGTTHVVWMDDAGRVLRVEVDALGYRAMRTAAPASE